MGGVAGVWGVGWGGLSITQASYYNFMVHRKIPVDEWTAQEQSFNTCICIQFGHLGSCVYVTLPIVSVLSHSAVAACVFLGSSWLKSPLRVQSNNQRQTDRRVIQRLLRFLFVFPFLTLSLFLPRYNSPTACQLFSSSSATILFATSFSVFLCLSLSLFLPLWRNF